MTAHSGPNEGSRGRRIAFPTPTLDTSAHEGVSYSAYTSDLQFRILGPLEVLARNGPLPLGGPKQRAVLAHLVLRADEVVPTETLLDQIWGEEPPDTARAIIQTYISLLRRALGRDRIQSQPPGYSLRLDPAELDAARFEALVRNAQKALPIDANVALGTLEDALALWRGPALADLADQPSLLAEAARLDELRLDAQEARIEALLATSQEARAIGGLETLVAQHPLKESLWGLLMLGLYRDGRQAEALSTYQRAREILAEELGIDPSPELRTLHERVLTQDPGLDLRGEPLRGYRLLEKIGEGPRAVVFRGIQPRVGRDVAVKMFHEPVASDLAFVRRFERVGQALASLEHPHIAPVYDYWREPGRAYIVSRYLKGGCLGDVMGRGESVDPERAALVVEQIASAIGFAHRRGVPHGNVGPTNVLFDGEGNAYLTDLGAETGADPAADIEGLAALAQSLLPDNARLRELVRDADDGPGELDAAALADALRTELRSVPYSGRDRFDGRNPYKGIRPFTEADAPDFFGRGELAKRLIARMKDPQRGSRFMAIVGPSGAGKSSILRAGVIPEIRRGALGDPEGCFIAEMFPGRHPLDELEAALQRVAVRSTSRLHDLLASGSRGLLNAVDRLLPTEGELVLVIDQFEEIFTLASDERGRELFLESLRVATVDPDSRIRVIVTLRADFYDRPLAYARFGELLAQRTEAVPPLSPDEVEQAIRLPAEGVGVSPEPALVAQIIADVSHQPGALPLVQYSLTELFEQRHDGRLTLEAYRESGGIAGALSARADLIFEGADAERRRASKQVFLRLVTLGEGRQDTRRRVARSELDSLDVNPRAVDDVLDTFGHYRLLTFDRDPSSREPTVEIAHEALLTAWRRLRDWIEEAREDLRHDRSVARARAEWRASGRDPSFLLRGARLEQMQAWAESTDLALGRPELAYLKESVDQRDLERMEREAQTEHEAKIERRSSNRLRALVVVFAVAALVASTLTVIAVGQRREAAKQSRIAFARELASAAVANLDVDPERSVLLAMEAVDQTRSVDGSVLQEAVQSLHDAVGASRTVSSIPAVGGSVAWSWSGMFVAERSDSPGLLDVIDESTGRSARAIEAHDGAITDVAMSPDGSMLASGGDDGWLKVWDPSSGRLVARFHGEGTVSGLAFSDSPVLLAGAWADGLVRIVDPIKEREIRTFDVPGASATALRPDGGAVAVTAGPVVVIEVDTGRHLLRPLQPRSSSGRPYPTTAVSWSPDGLSIATGSLTATGDVWDATTGKLQYTLSGHTGVVEDVAWAPDSRTIATGGSDGTVRVWQLERRSARVAVTLRAQEMAGGILCVAFSPDGTHLLASAHDGAALKIWDVSRTGQGERGTFPGVGFLGDVDFMPDGGRLVAARPNGAAAGGRVSIWDLETGEAVAAVGPPVREHWFDLSADGASIAIYGPDSVTAWSTETRDEIFEADVHNAEFDWSPTGALLVTAPIASATARIFDRSGHEVAALDGGSSFEIQAARFSPDGRLIATIGSDASGGKISIWDWQRARVLRTMAANGFDVVFDPAASRVVTAGGEGSPAIWDVASGRRLVVLTGHAGPVFGVAFSPDGARVATGGVDGTVRLFDAKSGGQLLVLRGHDLAVRTVSFSPDGTMLASQSPGEVRVWSLDIDDLLDIADANVTRELTDSECRAYLHLDRCPS